MKKIFLSLIISASLIIAGCSQKKTENTSPDANKKSGDTTKNTNNGALTFADKKFMKSFNNCNPSDTCTYFSVEYIEASGGKIKDKLNSFIGKEILAGVSFADTSYSSIQVAADSFMVSYSSFRKEFPESAQFWYYEYSMKIANETPKILCLSSENSSYMGGAHPNTFTEFINISKETGDTLSLANFFAAGWEPKLNKLIDAKFRQMKGLKPGDNLQEKGDLFDNKITFNYNVIVNKDGGLDFYYNPYEIAAYVFGPITVSLSKSEIADLLSPDSLLK